MCDSDFEDQPFSRVSDFYNGKSVFVTGASGFVGSVLLELLLRCFPGVKAIYILLRTKKNLQPEVRKEQIFNKKIFKELKDENSECLDKVHVIAGDVSLPNLGMSDEDLEKLIDEVAIVFHCAATVNFSKPLKFALLNNVVSVKSVIELCRSMKKFEALVYTSTAFSNCNHTTLVLKEEVYRLPFRADKFLDALETEDSEKLLELFAHCKPDWPNTYVFSKCLAENLIMDTASDLPVAIIRPSTVFTTLKKPRNGYIEENSGIMALSIAAGKGFVRVVEADPKVKLNLVPADIVANAHVLAAWSIGTKRCASPFIVNCTATKNLHIEFSDYNETLTQLCHKFPLPQSFREYTRLIIVPNKYLYYIAAAYHHYMPAIVLDGMLKISGQKPKIFSLYRFFDTVMSSLKFFLFHTFEFERNNLKYLDTLIHPEDREDLSLDFEDATFEEVSLKMPENSPFYDWKIDRKSQMERQNVKYRRYIITNCIQGMFVMIICLLIYWMLSLIFS